mgnify:CR=1 FL=1
MSDEDKAIALWNKICGEGHEVVLPILEAALLEEREAERVQLAAHFETLSLMTTEPQATCYRFAVHTIRSRSHGGKLIATEVKQHDDKAG